MTKLSAAQLHEGKTHLCIVAQARSAGIFLNVVEIGWVHATRVALEHPVLGEDGVRLPFGLVLLAKELGEWVRRVGLRRSVGSVFNGSERLSCGRRLGRLLALALPSLLVGVADQNVWLR